MNFNKNFVFLCKQKGISQNKIANDLNIPPSSIKNIFQGKVKSINLDYAHKISKYLGISLIEMIEEDLSKEQE